MRKVGPPAPECPERVLLLVEGREEVHGLAHQQAEADVGQGPRTTTKSTSAAAYGQDRPGITALGSTPPSCMGA